MAAIDTIVRSDAERSVSLEGHGMEVDCPKARSAFLGGPFQASPDLPENPIILSFDVEEHHRIEAAAGLDMPASLHAYHENRVDVSTRWLLGELSERGIQATFFIVGQIAVHNPKLVRDIARAGHEVASHSWDHQRIHHHTPASFREDVLKSKDALEQVTGQAVVGYRAPTFSIVKQTIWALDVLAELGILYDSSIYPVWHDRYGIPKAPRVPFLAQGDRHGILEMPIATWQVLKTNLPVGGGGYFRLLPLFFMERAIRQIQRSNWPGVTMLYFHPWEFDPDQKRLPLRGFRRFRTYVGLNRSRGRLQTFIGRHAFQRADQVANALSSRRDDLTVWNSRTGS